MNKKSETIERLVQWAYREELPKGYERGGEGYASAASSVSPMFRLADLGTRVDEWATEPGFPAAMGQPHPDSLMIDAAVIRLPDVGLDWARSRPRLMHDLKDWVSPTDPILSAMSFQPAALVMVHAKMGTRPIWDLGKPKVIRVNGKNGKPIVQYIDEETGDLIEGRTTGRHYGPGARCPLKLDPEPREIACARAEYVVWQQALVQLANTLRAWNLHDHVVLPPTAAPEPWIADPEPKPRILRSNRAISVFA